MYNHEPSEYKCPFCLVASGGADHLSSQDDVVFRGDNTTAFISPRWWKSNPGHVIVVPNDHVENIYDIDDNALSASYSTAKRVATAMRESYGCEGTSMRQHNEPAGDQDLWHFHIHVFPRYKDDSLYLNHTDTLVSEAEERVDYVNRLRKALSWEP